MTRIAFCGFEAGETSADKNGVGGTNTLSYDTATVHGGSRSLKLITTSAAIGYVALSPSVGKNYWRIYVNIQTFPTTTARILLGQRPGSPSADINVRLNPNGTLGVYVYDTLQGTSSTALLAGRWYRLEIRGATSGVGVSVPVLLIDGNTEVSFEVTSVTQILGTIGPDDAVADTYTAYFDDFAEDDAGFPGNGYVVLLNPTSLNAAGGWVEGDGAGTAGMAAAVATRPPPGVASANETSATNIESPTNSATDNCDMNMTTYAAAGISQGDVINAVRGMVRQGEDIATSTKAGALIIVSNPVQVGETTFTYGSDLGAHGAEVGNWVTTFGAIQASPSIVLTTAPVLRVGKRTATTRVVCVDFMGIYVDYTPGNRYPKARNINQSLNRASSF